MASTSGEKEIKTKWPIEKGLIARTTSQTGRAMTLIAEQGSLVSKKDKVGLED